MLLPETNHAKTRLCQKMVLTKLGLVLRLCKILQVFLWEDASSARQKPWHDSSLEGASGAKGVQLAGKGRSAKISSLCSRAGPVSLPTILEEWS